MNKEKKQDLGCLGMILVPLVIMGLYAKKLWWLAIPLAFIGVGALYLIDWQR